MHSATVRHSGDSDRDQESIAQEYGPKVRSESKVYRYVIGEIDQPGILPNSNRESQATGRFHRRLRSRESNRNSLDISCDSLDTKFSFTHLLKDQVGRGKRPLRREE